MPESSIDLAADLLECLSHLEPSDSTKAFGLFEVLVNPPNPGLCLKNGGPIGLPLSEGDTKVFKAAANLLSFKSCFSNSVWMLPADDFELQNPAWDFFLHGITTKVSAGLGVDSTGKSVSAKLYSLSLQDADPAPTTLEIASDRELNPKPFGTLTITLPTEYKGGELTLSCGTTQVVEACQMSAFNASYAAWFSDVTHEFKPISAGRRLSLTYHLFHSNLGPDVLSACSNKSMAKLDLLFSHWKDNVEEEPSMLASLLPEDADDTKLCYNNLDGLNLQVLQYLRPVAEKYGFCIYLAQLKRVIEFEGDSYDDYEELDPQDLDQSQAESTLQQVVELDGTVVAENMYFEDNMLIQQDPFEGEEPDDEDEDRNALYFRTMVLFMPKRYRIAHFLTPTFPRVVQIWSGWTETKGTTYAPDVTGWVERLLASFNQSGNLRDREDLEEICQLVITNMQSWREGESRGIKAPQPYSSDDISSVVVASVELDMKDIFLETFELCSHEIPASTFKHIGAASLRYGMVDLLPKLSSHVSAFDHLWRRLDIINAVQEGLMAERERNCHLDVTKYQTWVDDEAYRAITLPRVPITLAEDGIALANYCKALPRPEMLQEVLVAVTNNTSRTSMIMAFLFSIFGAGTEGQVSQDIVRAVFAYIMPKMVNGFGLLALDAVVDQTPPTIYSYLPPQTKRVLDTERIHDIALLLCHCQYLHLSTELNLIALKLAEEANTISIDYFELLFLPFLETLGSTVRENDIPISNSPFQVVFQQTLSIYIHRFVQPEPQPSRDWSRPTVTCDCQDCSSLNRFLADPRQQWTSFTINGKRREHVWSKVSDTGMDHHIHKSGSCFSLVLTKNEKYFDKLHREWMDRCSVAKSHLQRIDREIDLKPFLAETYDSIISLSILSSRSLLVPSLTLPALPTGGSQNAPQPLHALDNNIQRTGQLPSIPSTLSSTIAGQWGPLPPLQLKGTSENTYAPQGTKRKASDHIQQGQSSKRQAAEAIVLDD